jgi:hypothetical protein
MERTRLKVFAVNELQAKKRPRKTPVCGLIGALGN